MKLTEGEAELIREESDGEFRYRITKTKQGFLVTSRAKSEMGMLLPCEWLHQTEQAAQACLDAVLGTEAFFRASRQGFPTETLMRKLEALLGAHKKLCAELDDRPAIGEEVRQLRVELKLADS